MGIGHKQPHTAVLPAQTCLPPWEAAWRTLTLEQQRLHHAYHEAGHTVVAWHFGFPIRSVSVEPGGMTQGRVRYASSLTRRDRRLQLAALEAGRVAVAGLCRSQGWDQSLADKGVEGDEDAAFDLAVAWVGATRHRTPGQTEKQWIEHVGIPVLKELEQASNHARLVLEAPGYWHAVARVAAALLEQTTITGKQAHLVILAALQEVQQKAKATA